MNVFPIITNKIQMSFEHDILDPMIISKIPIICGYAGRACRNFNEKASNAPCLDCPLAEYAEKKQGGIYHGKL